MKQTSNHKNEEEFFKQDEEKEKKAIKEAEKNYSSKELDPYAISYFHKIPYGIKAIVLKYWFFGALYFFVGIGLGQFIQGLDFIVVASLILGLIYDFLINKILTLMDTDLKESKRYTMFISKKMYSVFINIAYSLALMFATYYAIEGIGLLIDAIFNSSQNIIFGQEPFSFALIAIIIDYLFITIKNLIVKLIKKENKK